jgi:hypothetical protein
MTEEPTHEAVERDEFLTPASPPDMVCTQIVSDDSRDSEAVYMDCSSWTPDSQRFVFWRGASDDGEKPAGMWLCDVADRCSVQPVFTHDDALTLHTFHSGDHGFCGAALAPNGTAAYRIDRAGDSLVVTRRDLATGVNDEVGAAPAPFTIRGSITVSGDSRHLCVGVWLGDGETAGAPWGAYIFDVVAGTHWAIPFGNGFRNMHCQYSRSAEPPHCYDLLLLGGNGKLSDGSWLTPPDGSWRWQDMPPPFPKGEGGITASHVVRDDGTNWRMVPIGDSTEISHGGHCGFRGTTSSVVAAAYDLRGGKWRSPIFEADPVAVEVDDPRRWQGHAAAGVAQPLDLCRHLARADTCHHANDLSGRRFISDTDGYNHGPNSYVWIASYAMHADGLPYLAPRYLLFPRSSWQGQPAHAHPLLSPDGRHAVIQSDFSGRPQVTVATGFDWPHT